MARDEAQYQSLLKLRQAIVEKTAAQRKKEEASKWLNDNSFQLEEPSKRKEITACRDKVYEKFEAPYLRNVDKKDRVGATIRFIIKLVLYLTLVAAVLGGGGFGVYHLIKWSWNTCITKLMEEGFQLRLGCIGQMLSQEPFSYADSVLVYFCSFSIIFGVVFFIAREMDKTFIIVLSLILAIPPLAYGLFIMIREMFSEITWVTILELLLLPLGLIALVLYGIKPLLFTLPVAVAVIALIVAAVFCVIGLFTISWNRKYTKVKIPDFDIAKFMASQRYQDATEIDKILTEKDQKSYTNYYNKELEIYGKRRENQEKAIRDYNAIIVRCNQTIQGSTFIHNDYKTIRNLSTIIYYIEHNRADNITEAINLYIQDQQAMTIIDKLDNIQRTQLQMMNKVLQETEKRFNSLEATIQKEVAKVNASIEAQEKSLKESLQEIKKSNDENALSIMQATREASNSLATSLNYNLSSIRSNLEYIRIYD